MEKPQIKRNSSKTPSDLRTNNSGMDPERRAKRPKLDSDAEKEEKPRIPDDVLFTIFSFLPIRDRMRLSLVSKRFRQLVSFDPKRTVWKDIGTLSLTLEGGKDDRVSTINGYRFAPDRRTKAVQLLLDFCAPFKRVEISVYNATVDDLPWTKNIFLRSLMEAQTAAGKGAPPELSFRGNLRYAPAVFEKLVDGHTTRIDIEIGSQQHLNMAAGWRMMKLKIVWSKIATCTNLTHFHFGSNANFLLDTEHALAALSGKESLQRLSFKMVYLRLGFGPVASFVENIAAIANSCPSLVALNYAQKSSYEDYVTPLLLDLLEPRTRQRLQEFTICGEPEENADIDLNQPLEVGPDMGAYVRNILFSQFTNLRKLTLNLENAAPFIKAFLAEHQLEDKILYMDLDFSFHPTDFENHRAALFGEMESVCDGFAMALEGRFAFVKGFALVACRFVEEEWPDENLN